MPKARRRVRIKTPPLLFDATQRVIARIQRNVEGAFLTYWTSTSGSVCDNDVMALHELLETLGPKKQLTLFVKSDGGRGMASLRLDHLILRYVSHVLMLITLYLDSSALSHSIVVS